ncbi:MAG: PAN domain-containing protein, partial [Myxococcaceae bacterium]
PPPAAPPTPPPAAPTPAPPAAAPGGFEYNVDRPGSDLLNFDFPNGTVEQNAAACAAACQKDQRCRAWTFVRSGVQGPKSRCWLKSAVPPPVPNANYAISGVVRPDGAVPPPAR